jgi:manganese/zinc/iron transport system substrate-binding protein
MRALLLALALACAAAAAGCGPIPESTVPDLSDKETIRVVTTVGMIADAVERVGGERVEVEGLMGPGIDPHLYKASEGDVRRLERADVIFYGGLHLEAKMADVLERVGERRLTRAVTDGIPRARLIPAGGGQHDPHVWFDVDLWKGAVREVGDTLAAADPAHAAGYRARAAAYVEELDALDGEVRRKSDSVPPDARVIVTAHDAFGYFGRAYGYEVVGLQGMRAQRTSKPSRI